MANTPLNPNLKGFPFNDYRDEIWGDSFNWSFPRKFDQVQKLVIHHAVTKRSATPDDIALLHKARGWDGIGYHFVVAENGTVFYVGDIGVARANVTANNEKVIGICLPGDFTKELQTKEQIYATKYLCEYFMTQFPALVNINNWDDVCGHKDTYGMWPGTTATACPGTNWKSSGDSFYERLKTGHTDGYPTVTGIIDTPTTPPPAPEPTPEPTPTPTPEPQPAPEPPSNAPEDPIPTPTPPVEHPDTVLVRQSKEILYGKGFWWTKLNKLKVLLPR